MHIDHDRKREGEREREKKDKRKREREEKKEWGRGRGRGREKARGKKLPKELGLGPLPIASTWMKVGFSLKVQGRKKRIFWDLQHTVA